MTSMTIDVPIAMDYGDPWVDVKARPLFDLAPHLASVATFVLFKETLGWNVTNVETGLYVAKGKTRDAALALARRTLRRKTARQLLYAYKRSMNKYPQLRAQ